ncbi:hypothetical protein CE143_11100 [Photorhabdus luminescens]|uniref:Uncharacterized protein n=1 Tax=Photorhabdus akhurstii TaxID=171438 RepID=A0ABX8LSX5_9GAMM|nr:hypothetical protein C6H64_10245 [Photorhabdus luminescens]PQQ34553.1 hypothetical protein C6H69_04865 [Photorhabdus luminescens]QXF33644.1 hypothetical protein B0X70_11185 [Photorhabdus akhurstii]UJD75441.1 hypothetical protein CE143_11100 [Photorhabdus luminescens]
MPFIAMLFMSIVMFFFLTILVNYFFILERNVKKTIWVSLLMTVIFIFSLFAPTIIYQNIF